MEGSLVALHVAVIKVVIAGRLSVAFRRKLRQTLALLARGKADADSQAGGEVATVILCAACAPLHHNMTDHFRPWRDCQSAGSVSPKPTVVGWAESYWGTVGTGASGWDARAERSMAMAA